MSTGSVTFRPAARLRCGAHPAEGGGMKTTPGPRRRGLLVSLTAVVGLVFSACTGSTPSPAASAAAGSAADGGSGGAVTLPAPEKKTLKVGLSTGGEASQYAEYLASQLDFYKKYGGFDSGEGSGLPGDAKGVPALVARGPAKGALRASGAINSPGAGTPSKGVSTNGVK